MKARTLIAMGFIAASHTSVQSGACSAECAQQLARVSSNSRALLLLRRAQVDGPHTESKRAHRSWQDERGAKALHRIFRGAHALIVTLGCLIERANESVEHQARPPAASLSVRRFVHGG